VPVRRTYDLLGIHEDSSGPQPCEDAAKQALLGLVSEMVDGEGAYDCVERSLGQRAGEISDPVDDQIADALASYHEHVGIGVKEGLAGKQRLVVWDPSTDQVISSTGRPFVLGRPETGTLDDLLAEVADVHLGQSIELWIPNNLTFKGQPIEHSVGMAMIEDATVQRGLVREGAIPGHEGVSYQYKLP
jgi:hypothetical protein